MIQNPNTSGQGFDPDHDNNPYHGIIMGAGFTYSHTTPVVYPLNDRVMHHTYAFGQRKLGVDFHNGKWVWNSKTSSASGRETRGATAESLKKHLRNIVRGGRPRGAR